MVVFKVNQDRVHLILVAPALCDRHWYLILISLSVKPPLSLPLDLDVIFWDSIPTSKLFIRQCGCVMADILWKVLLEGHSRSASE